MINQEVIKTISSQQKTFIKKLNRFCGIVPKINQKTSTEINAIAHAHASICDNVLKEFPPTNTETISNLESVNVDSNPFERIKKVSKEWSEQDSIRNALQQIKDDEQCFFITDLPVEWLQKDGVPLAFLNDTCRLPYASKDFHNQYFEDLCEKKFSISRNVLDKTLVLMCSPNDCDLNLIYDKQIEAFNKIGFTNYKKCFSKESFVSEINDKNPDVLIIDTHGNYSEVDGESSSFITVCGEIIDSEDVSMLKEIPKIIFLSACNTRPVKNIEECIVDAFIKRGALAVTASYVELDADQELSTICRFINNLKQASDSKNVHPNWLSFISHLQRTFFAQTIKINFGINNGYRKDSKILLDEINLLKKKTSVEEELSLYEIVKNRVSENMKPQDLLALEQTLVGGSITARKFFFPQWMQNSMISSNLVYGKHFPEFFYFTNYGRMDLISFDVEKTLIDPHTESVLRSVNRINTMVAIENKLHLVSKYMATRSLSEEKKFWKKIGRNDLCPCGSGKKYKKCHGK